MAAPVDDTVVLAVIGAAFLHASWNALWKARGDHEATATGICLTWSALGWIGVLVAGALPREAWPMVVASSAVHLVYFEVLRHAYQLGDLSLVYPIARGTPPLLVAAGMALFLGEPLSPTGMAGVAAIALGSVALGPTAGGLPRRAVLFALASAGCTATYTIVDGLGTRASDPATYLVWFMALQGSTYAAFALTRSGGKLVGRVWERRGTAFTAGVVSAGGYGVALWAMTHAPIATVAALRETSVFFAAVIGAVLLAEPAPRRRIAAAAVVALGAGLLRLG